MILEAFQDLSRWYHHRMGAYSDALLDGDGTDSPGGVEALLSPLLPEAHRWRGLALAIRNYSLTFPVLGNFQLIAA